MPVGTTAPSQPVDEFLRLACEAGGRAFFPKHICRHRRRPPVSLRDEPANILGARIDEILQIGVVNEPGSAWPELTCSLPHVGANRIRFGVHQRVETEDEIDAAVFNLVEREAVVDDVLDVPSVCKTMPAGVDASLR